MIHFSFPGWWLLVLVFVVMLLAGAGGKAVLQLLLLVSFLIGVAFVVGLYFGSNK